MPAEIQKIRQLFEIESMEPVSRSPRASSFCIGHGRGGNGTAGRNEILQIESEKNGADRSAAKSCGFAK
eukprot:540546-Rhodomonas_salina.1